MKLSKAKKKAHRVGELVLILAVLVCMSFALISTHQLNESIDRGNRKIVLNYGNQVAARIHDLFERVDVSLANVGRQMEVMAVLTEWTPQEYLSEYESIWDMDASGLLYEDGGASLSDGSAVVFENEISLQDVLSYSQKLNISRQNINGQEMLVFAKPCKVQVGEQMVSGIFAAMKMERLEAYLGDYGYSSDSFMVVTQANGDNVWKQENTSEDKMGNCFEELGELSIDQGDSILQMQTRMTVAMDGTISYSRDGQDYYMAYVPLGVNYWYLLVGARSDSIDLTELARQHYVVAAMLMIGIVAMGTACSIYLIQRNRSILQYNKQLQVATSMANQANKANQANRAKQEFLAKVSHDIRTPLNGAIGMLTLAKDEYEDKEKCLGYLDKASISAEYLLSLLNDVLDMSQIESGKLKLVEEQVEMRALLKEIDAIMETGAREKGISFKMDDSALEHDHFMGDQLRIKQILMNLCSNAVKYTHRGGWIRLEVEEQQGTEKNQVIFKVKDNGEGIAEDKLDVIFKPFEQAGTKRQGGVGLGLSIVRSFVELMGGNITVESRVDIGSVFTVTIPLQVVEPPTDTVTEKEKFDLQGISILLAEDNEINAEIAVALLEKCGARVTHTEDGEAVVDAFGSAPQGTYDLILMDIQMPKKNGLEATREIRKMDRTDASRIPILSMTANAFKEQVEEMHEAGMNDFLYKPIDIEVVCTCINKWVGRE